MEEDYKEIRKAADRAYHRFRDKVDNADAAYADQLQQQLKRIVEEIDSNKDPRSIEERIKQAQQAIKNLDTQEEKMMSNSDADELYDMYEEIREDVRELPNY